MYVSSRVAWNAARKKAADAFVRNHVGALLWADFARMDQFLQLPQAEPPAGDHQRGAIRIDPPREALFCADRTTGYSDADFDRLVAALRAGHIPLHFVCYYYFFNLK
jgi:hypothetical protein